MIIFLCGLEMILVSTSYLVISFHALVNLLILVDVLLYMYNNRFNTHNGNQCFFSDLESGQAMWLEEICITGSIIMQCKMCYKHRCKGSEGVHSLSAGKTLW